MTADALLTVSDVAARCKVNARTVRRWIAQNELSVLRLGRVIRVTESALTRFLKGCQNRSVVADANSTSPSESRS